MWQKDRAGVHKLQNDLDCRNVTVRHVEFECKVLLRTVVRLLERGTEFHTHLTVPPRITTSSTTITLSHQLICTTHHRLGVIHTSACHLGKHFKADDSICFTDQIPCLRPKYSVKSLKAFEFCRCALPINRHFMHYQSGRTTNAIRLSVCPYDYSRNNAIYICT